ncbi:cytochrome C [Zhengella mangrovi]|uniref:Cytochrome C n=1 Tax=Zhengella mangrovi TaxID=1982044 RepID=A0A2G1QMT7_9HYPH|nr:cytochrome c [Zhengella mangrovi]PHP66833.1 cytochrome C [Zhengella mangrovi]
MKTIARIALCAAAALALPVMAPRAGEQSDRLARGAYLVSIMDCAGCHAPRGPGGAPVPGAGLSGGTVGFEIPGLGVFWPSNLTPHASGLAGWSEADIIRTLRTGTAPDGLVLAPVMPFPAYAAMKEDDLVAIAAYLRSLEPEAGTAQEPVADSSAARLPFYRVTLPGAGQ